MTFYGRASALWAPFTSHFGPKTRQGLSSDRDRDQPRRCPRDVGIKRTNRRTSPKCSTGFRSRSKVRMYSERLRGDQAPWRRTGLYAYATSDGPLLGVLARAVGPRRRRNRSRGQLLGETTMVESNLTAPPATPFYKDHVLYHVLEAGGIPSIPAWEFSGAGDRAGQTLLSREPCNASTIRRPVSRANFRRGALERRMLSSAYPTGSPVRRW